jgi:hypothetical protein
VAVWPSVTHAKQPPLSKLPEIIVTGLFCDIISPDIKKAFIATK